MLCYPAPTEFVPFRATIARSPKQSTEVVSIPALCLNAKIAKCDESDRLHGKTCHWRWASFYQSLEWCRHNVEFKVDGAMARATISGLEIEYRIYGEGRPVLFIHGGFGGPNSSLLASPNAITQDIPKGFQPVSYPHLRAHET